LKDGHIILRSSFGSFNRGYPQSSSDRAKWE
jgi:hypothetical protein